MQKLLARAALFIRESRAVSAIEYAILVGVIAVGIAAALATFSTNITTGITAVGTQVAAPNPEDIDL